MNVKELLLELNIQLLSNELTGKEKVMINDVRGDLRELKILEVRDKELWLTE